MRASLTLVACFAVCACGGGAPELVHPAPIKYTIDDFHLAPIPVENKKAVIDSKQELDVALMEKAKAQSDFEDNKTKLEISRNDARGAELHAQSANTERSAAQKTANMTQQNVAAEHVHTAEMEKAATAARVEYLKARQAWLERLVRAREFEAAAKEAKWQLEKARVAQANNIRPQGFDVLNFEKQLNERNDQFNRTKNDADREQGKVADREKDWTAKQHAWDQKHGAASSGPPPPPAPEPGPRAPGPAPEPGPAPAPAPGNQPAP